MSAYGHEGRHRAQHRFYPPRHLSPRHHVGNAHTPAWVGLLGSLVPGPFGNIDQRILGRSIAAEIALHSREAGEVIRENAAMKKLATQFNSVTLAFLRDV
jgi:hypothetical protein